MAAPAIPPSAYGIDLTARSGVKLTRILRNMERARDTNPYLLPDYGSGPTAGKAVPVVTIGSTAPTGGQMFGFNDAAGKDYAACYGGILTQASGSLYSPIVVASSQGYPGSPLAANRSAGPWAIEFVTDEASPSIAMPVPSQGKYRILVDGQYLNRVPNLLTGTGIVYPNIAFATRSAKGRTIRFEAEWPNQIGRIYVGAASSVWKPTPPDFVRCAWFGDSWAQWNSTITPSNGAKTFGHDNYAMGVMRNLGVTDACSLGVGSTGFASDFDANNVRYTGRMNDLALLHAQPGGVGLVVGQGSINDQNKAPATITAEVVSWIRSARAIVGASTPIILTGVPSGALGTTGAVQAGVLAAENAIIAGIAEVADPMTAFVPFSTRTRQPILYGSLADGPASIYMANDLYHPMGGDWPTVSGGYEYVVNAVTPGFQNALTSLLR